MNITSAAKSLSEAQINFDKEWHKYFASIPLLDRKRFWELVPHLISNLDVRDFDSKKACREFVRKSECEENYTFDEAMRFSRAWDAYKSDLHSSQMFDEINFGKSDDGYGDLIDSLPLAGAEFMGRCLVGDFAGNKDFFEALVQVTPFAKQIYDGENYFGVFLEDSVKEFFLYRVN